MEANQFFTQTYIDISSSTLGDTESVKTGKKRQRKKAAVFAKHLADVFQPHEQESDEEMLKFLESPALPVEPIKHHIKGNKQRNRTLKYEKRN